MWKASWDTNLCLERPNLTNKWSPKPMPGSYNRGLLILSPMYLQLSHHSLHSPLMQNSSKHDLPIAKAIYTVSKQGHSRGNQYSLLFTSWERTIANVASEIKSINIPGFAKAMFCCHAVDRGSGVVSSSTHQNMPRRKAERTSFFYRKGWKNHIQHGRVHKVCSFGVFSASVFFEYSHTLWFLLSGVIASTGGSVNESDWLDLKSEVCLPLDSLSHWLSDYWLQWEWQWQVTVALLALPVLSSVPIKLTFA